MKKFVFSMERMLHFCRQVLQKEKNLMGQMLEEKNTWEKRQEMIERQLEDIHGRMDNDIRQGTTSFQIRAHTTLIKNGKKQLEEIKKQLLKITAEIDTQRLVVIEASQEVSKLEKLEEKQWEEYRHAEAREQEEIVAEHVASRYIRQGVS